MRAPITLAVVAAAASGVLLATSQGAAALPQPSDAKQVTKSAVEKAGYRYHRRYWRHRHYGHRHYYRRPGFGIYLGY